VNQSSGCAFTLLLHCVSVRVAPAPASHSLAMTSGTPNSALRCGILIKVLRSNAIENEFAYAHTILKIPHHATLRFAVRNSEMKYCVALGVLLAHTPPPNSALRCGILIKVLRSNANNRIRNRS
jgi:ribosomal protein S12